MQTEPSGILLIDKPAGITSFDIIRQIRRQTGIRKIGHAGTLDPLATGLMIMLVGRATKLSDRYMKQDKRYVTRIHLGETSSTGDAEGSRVKVSEAQPSLSQIEAAIASFQGEVSQTPPQYSAIKVGGVPAYRTARKGKTVEIPERKVQIYSIDLIKYEYPLVEFAAHVSSGTYIRTLAEDIGSLLDTGAYVTGLRRESIAGYSIEDAATINEVTATTIDNHLMKIAP